EQRCRSILMTRLLRVPVQPGHTIRATVAANLIPNGLHRANDPPFASDAAPPAATPLGWVGPKVFRIAMQPTSRRAVSSVRARRNRKALSATSQIGGKFALRGLLRERALFSQTMRVAKQRRRVVRVARL